MSAIRRGAGDAPGDQLGAAGGDGPVAGGAAGDEPRPAGDADRHRPGHHPQEPQGELQVLPGQEADEAQDGEGPDPDPGAGGGGRESGRHEVVASDLRLHSLRCHSACYHCSASYQYLVYKYPSTIQYFCYIDINMKMQNIFCIVNILVVIK